MKFDAKDKESMQKSENENATYVPQLKMIYSQSKVFKEGTDSDEGTPFKIQDFNFKNHNLGKITKVIPVCYIGEASSVKGTGTDKETLEVVFLSKDGGANFGTRTEYLDMKDTYQDDEDVKVSLNHRVLVYLPAVKEFASINFSASTTEDYTKMLNASTDNHVVEVSNWKVPNMKFDWFRIDSKPLAEIVDPESIKDVDDAIKTFMKRTV